MKRFILLTAFLAMQNLYANSNYCLEQFKTPNVPVDLFLGQPANCKKLPEGDFLKVYSPYKYWGASAVQLLGYANTDVVSKILQPYGLTPLLQNGYAVVGITVADYGQSSAGPSKPFFVTYFVNDNTICQNGECVPGAFFGQYYTNTIVDKLAGKGLFGIEKVIAHTETQFKGGIKGARLTVGEDLVATIKVDVASRKLEESAITNLIFGVSKGTNGNGLDKNLITYQGSATSLFPYDQTLDKFEVSPKSKLGQQLETIQFVPGFWQYFSNYAGIYPDSIEQ